MYKEYKYDFEPSEADELLEEFKDKAWELIRPNTQIALEERDEAISYLKETISEANKTIDELRNEVREKTFLCEQQEKKHTKDLMKTLEEYCGKNYYIIKRELNQKPDVKTVISKKPIPENDKYFTEAKTVTRKEYAYVEEVRLISILSNLFIDTGGAVFGSVETEDASGYTERKRVKIIDKYTGETKDFDTWENKIVFSSKDEAQKYADELTKEMQVPATTYSLVRKKD